MITEDKDEYGEEYFYFHVIGHGANTETGESINFCTTQTGL